MKQLSIFLLLSFLFSHATECSDDYIFTYKKQSFFVCNSKMDGVKFEEIEGTKIRVYSYQGIVYLVGNFTEISIFFEKTGFSLIRNKGKKHKDFYEFTYKNLVASNLEFLLATIDGMYNLPSYVLYDKDDVVFTVTKKVSRSKKRKIPIY